MVIDGNLLCEDMGLSLSGFKFKFHSCILFVIPCLTRNPGFPVKTGTYFLYSSLLSQSLPRTRYGGRRLDSCWSLPLDSHFRGNDRRRRNDNIKEVF
jgi:hypothetical protein